MLVGEADLETWEITHKARSRTRPERLQALARSLQAEDVRVRLEVIPGMSHDRLKVLPRVQDFLAAVLTTMRAGR